MCQIHVLVLRRFTNLNCTSLCGLQYKVLVPSMCLSGCLSDALFDISMLCKNVGRLWRSPLFNLWSKFILQNITKVIPESVNKKNAP